MCRKKRLGLQRNEIFNQGIFLGWGVQSYLENCAYLWKNPGYAPDSGPEIHAGYKINVQALQTALHILMPEG